MSLGETQPPGEAVGDDSAALGANSPTDDASSTTSLVVEPPPALDSPDPIVIPVIGDTPTTRLVIGQVLEMAGLSVELRPFAIESAQFDIPRALCAGDIAIVDDWRFEREPNFHPELDPLAAAGCAVIVTEYSAALSTGWWAPQYLVDQCPELPSWEALVTCPAVSTDGEFKPPAYISFNFNWRQQELFTQLELPFAVEYLPFATAEIWATAEPALDAGEPVLIYHSWPNELMWNPDGVWLDFSPWEHECDQEGTFGEETPPAVDHCGSYPIRDREQRLFVWEGLAEKWPTADNLLRAVDFTDEDFAQLWHATHTEGTPPNDAAAAWITDNADVVEQWLAGSS